MTQVVLTEEAAQHIEEALTFGEPDQIREAIIIIRAAKAQEFTAEQQDRFASAFDETFSKAGLPQKQDKKQGHFEQPNWAHVGQAFIDGAREAKMNPDASEEDFVRAADGYSKRLFEQLDPESARNAAAAIANMTGATDELP